VAAAGSRGLSRGQGLLLVLDPQAPQGSPLLQRLGVVAYQLLQHRLQPGPVVIQLGIEMLDVIASADGAIDRNTPPPPFRQSEAPLRWPQPMTVNRESLEKLGRFLLRGLRIGASTVSIVELLRNDWTGGISAGVAWLVFLQVERRLPPLSPEPEE
jgi:hypothetical protein